MDRDILSGQWFDIKSQDDFDTIRKYGGISPHSYLPARCQIGDYIGPGKYLLLRYSQRCPRNCCYDSVYELLSSKDVVEECKDKIGDLANLLKKARK